MRETVAAGDDALKGERKKRTRKKKKVGCGAHKQFLRAAPSLEPLTDGVKEAPDTPTLDVYEEGTCLGQSRMEPPGSGVRGA
jgi:hypothetical protein